MLVEARLYVLDKEKVNEKESERKEEKKAEIFDMKVQGVWFVWD